MKNITRAIFNDCKYGCPCHRAEYGSACIILDDRCCYEECPTLFWINVLSNINTDRDERFYKTFMNEWGE